MKVSARNLTFFADLSEYSRGDPDTKATESDSLLALESLLDRSMAEEFTYQNGNRVCQVPFKINRESTYAYICSPSAGAPAETVSVPKDSLSIVRKFLVTTDWANGNHTVRVATMICTPEYMSSCLENDENDISFLHKANFTGMVIMSRPDGTYLRTTYYNRGKVITTKLLKQDAAVSDNSELLGLYSLKKSCGTKSEDDVTLYDELEEICVVAEMRRRGVETTGGLNIGGYNGDGIEDRNRDEETDDEGEGGGADKDEDEDEDEDDDDGAWVRVQLAVNDNSLGTVSGSGQYESGSEVHIQATPKLVESTGKEACLYAWTGDLSEYGNAPTFNFPCLDHDIISMACFAKIVTRISCKDENKGIQNPLAEMSIPPTSKYLSAYTGTFGLTRIDPVTGKQKNHYGIDFYAEPGTPFYSMFSGRIVKIVDCQPDKVKIYNEETKDWEWVYPEGYTGDDNAAGNRIIVESVVNGKTIWVSYCHLDADESVAIDPESGKRYKVNDEVEQGELLGFTGKSGNAAGVPFKHLHLSVMEYINGKWTYTDPALYLNGTIPSDVLNGADGKSARYYRPGEKISLIDIICE